MSARIDRDRFMVEEMLRHLDLVQSIAKQGRAKVASDSLTRYGLEHAIELIAEAAKHTGGSFRSANPEVPWTDLRNVRRLVAHPYDVGSEEVNVGRLWRFAAEEAPKLTGQLKRVKFRA